MATLTELIAQYNEAAVAAGKPTRKGFASKALAEAALKELTKTKKSKVAKTEGGFRLDSPAWMNAVTAGSGIALRPANREKLEAHAASVGVKVSAKMEPAEICAAISAKA